MSQQLLPYGLSDCDGPELARVQEVIQHFADRLDLSIPDTLALICETVHDLDSLGLLRISAGRMFGALHCQYFLADERSPIRRGFRLTPPVAAEHTLRSF